MYWLVLYAERLSGRRRHHAGTENCAGDRRAWRAGRGEQIFRANRPTEYASPLLNQLLILSRFGWPSGKPADEVTTEVGVEANSARTGVFGLTCHFPEPQTRPPHLFEQPDRLHDTIEVKQAGA
jgi:hypothetical protein